MKQPRNKQVGGTHYEKMKITPYEYCHANQIGLIEGNIIKYVSRFREKNGKEDLLKAKQSIDELIRLEYGTETE